MLRTPCGRYLRQFKILFSPGTSVACQQSGLRTDGDFLDGGGRFKSDIRKILMDPVHYVGPERLMKVAVFLRKLHVDVTAGPDGSRVIRGKTCEHQIFIG